MSPEEIQKQLERLLCDVQKPARYVGGELNSVVKDWQRTPLRVALAFPDVYEIGLPNLGLAVLYEIINREPQMLAERVYAPWADMEAQLRRAGIPLFSLESKRPLREFDLVGLSLPYETLYANALNLLDLGGIPLRTAARGPADPVVVAGGHAMFNPEPMAAFLDAAVIGEGEEVVLEVARVVGSWRRGDRGDREALHRELARIAGVYVPSLYEVSYHADGTLARVTPRAPEAALPVRKRVVAALPAPPTRFIVPHLEVVHDRAVIEIMRGCTRGCRFCQAGVVTRPVRERPVEEVLAAVEQALAATGFGEVGLLSLSSSDYRDALRLVQEMAARFGPRRINISLPSLRIESFSVELMHALERGARRGGFTLAPEAATERVRATINKPVTTEQLLATAAEVFAHGWHTIKLYFMIGHPGETLADVEAIAAVVRQVYAEGRKRLGGRAKVHVGVSTFVPKPHTPLQWAPLAPAAAIRERQALLRRELRAKGIKLSYHAPEESLLEASLTRGDRRVSDAIEGAWRAGARFDAWQEHHQLARWEAAFGACGLDLGFFAHRERAVDELLPWDHIWAVDRAYLEEDWAQSGRGELRPDCRERCYVCGILPRLQQLRKDANAVWGCPGAARAPR